MNINRLNVDCLLAIFNNLTIREQSRCLSVCKRWSDLIRTIEVEELRVYFSKPFDESDPINLSIRTSLAFNKLLNSPKLNNLKKLNIHMNNDLKTEPLIDLSNLVNLVHLEIDYYLDSQTMLDHLIDRDMKLPNLRHLNVYKIDLKKMNRVFPNLLSLKTAYIEKLTNYERTSCSLTYFEQYNCLTVERTVINYLIENCTLIEYLSLSIDVTVQIPLLVRQLRNLRELNLNIPNDRLRCCFRNLATIFQSIGERAIKLRVNGLPVKSLADKKVNRFKVDREEIYTITYEQLQTSNKLLDYGIDDLRFYFNNFREIEITEKTLHVIKPLFIYDLVLKRIRKMTYHFKNRNSASYFIDNFFPKIPNLEHLFIAEVENLTENQLNKLPVLFPQVTFLELHAYKSVSFPIEFIGSFSQLQTIIIKNNGFIKEANFHRIIEKLSYLTSIEVDPIYAELFSFVEQRSKAHPEVVCHLHHFSIDEVKNSPVHFNNICIENHYWPDIHYFEPFNGHNYQFD